MHSARRKRADSNNLKRLSNMHYAMYVGYVSRGCCSRTTAVAFIFSNYTIVCEPTKVESADFVFGVACEALLSQSSISWVSYIIMFFTIDMELTFTLTLNHTKYRSECPLVTSLG